MNPELLQRLLPMLLLAHIAGLVRNHATTQQTLGAGAQLPAQPRPRKGPSRAAPGAMKQNPRNQGVRGKGQAARGATGPMKGGIPAMQNSLGQLPHQQPFAPQNNPLMQLLMGGMGMGQQR